MKQFGKSGTAGGQPGEDEMTFEEKTYLHARRWAKTRRGFLKTAVGAGMGGALVLAGTGARAQQRGGTISIARGQDSDTLDPQKTALLVAHEITWQIYDSLIYLDESGKVYPGLADSWSFSEDHKTVTFKLRPKVKFHDGTPFNAEAVRFTV